MSVHQTRNLILRGMCAVYLAAFSSLYIQIPGLYSENGLLPAQNQFEASNDLKKCFLEKKSLLCLAPKLGLSISDTMEVLSLVGTLFSFLGLISSHFCNKLVFVLMWLLYVSMYRVGQTFLWFQWDILLLETGFLAIILSPLQQSLTINKSTSQPRDILGLWLFKWLLFRFMFASGAVKLRSGCPSWWSLEALHIHFESQCLPTSLSYFAHHLPPWSLSMGVAATFVIELVVPFLFFSPFKNHKRFAFYTQILLQIVIILTGNYNFFNLATIVMCFALVDDSFLGYKTGWVAPESGLRRTLRTLIETVVFLIVFAVSFVFFPTKMTPKGPETKIGFTNSEFSNWLSLSVSLSVAIAIISLGLVISEVLSSAVFSNDTRTNFACGVKNSVCKFVCKIKAILNAVAYVLIAAAMFAITLTPYTLSLAPMKLPPPIVSLYELTAPYHVASSYGLFARMTGQEGRPEIILSVSNQGKSQWKEIEFKHKPGSLDGKNNRFIIPHQPRLDWQMWFASLSSFNQNPWLANLAYKILKGQPEVLSLLAKNSQQMFGIKFIKGDLYKYRYTKLGSKNIWSRQLDSEFFPPMESAELTNYLKKMKLISEKTTKSTPSYLKTILGQLRSILMIVEDYLVVWGLFFTALFIILTKKVFGQ